MLLFVHEHKVLKSSVLNEAYSAPSVVVYFDLKCVRSNIGPSKYTFIGQILLIGCHMLSPDLCSASCVFHQYVTF